MRQARVLVLAILLIGCAVATPVPVPTPTPTSQPAATTAPPPADTPAPAATPTPGEAPGPAGAPSHPGQPLPTERGTLFAGSGVCASCHTNLVDEAGQDMSIDRFWRATMMANASRDPYWRATVRTETLKAPDYEAVIEDKCATCHTPLAQVTEDAAGEQAELLDDGYFDPSHPLHTLALDGVSCTLCHQIEEAPFGETDSFSGGYVIDTELPAGERLNYGPFPVSSDSAALMQMASGFLPEESQHIRQSVLCGTCHVLYTPYLDAGGEIAGEFPEQAVFLEWLASDYRDAKSCQSCHMPAAQGGVVLSATGGEPRQPFAQHVLVGGNVFMLRALQAFPEENQVTAATEHFEATIGRVQDQLENYTASISVATASRDGDSLTADVQIVSRTGHKFPTGFPSRRAWIHFWVTDSSGQVIFESGAAGEDGAIRGNDNDADPSTFEPHYTLVEQPDQVQIYETIMANTEDEVTTTLLRAAGYLKDNRLLPAGFAKESQPADVAVYGAAADDADFVGGGDHVQYRVELAGAEGPLTIHVELLYETIGFRWAQNLADTASDEVGFFLDTYAAIPNTPLVVAYGTYEVP
jgi:mono/diheme cytochrome c family protein